MERLSRVRDAAVEAVLAGVLVAAVEGIRVAAGGPGGVGVLGTLAITAIAALALIAGALLVRAALALAIRLPPLAGWTRDLRSAGSARTVAAWRAVVIAAATVAFAVVAFRAFAWAHVSYRFHDADAIGAVVVVIDLAVGVLLVLAVLLADRVVRPRLPPALLDDRRRAIAAVALALALAIVVPTVLVMRAVPAFDIAPVPLVLLLVAALVVAMLVRPAAWRLLRWAALAALAGVLAGTWALGSLPRARLSIVERGAPSKLAARALWALADADGDGFAAASVGGADCDDGDPSRHPGATELAVNGIDENCTGSDAPALPPPAPAATPPAARPNILLISVDALRADRLGAYGYARATPVLDRLAADGARFVYAYTSCPSTRCAIPSLHTGRFRPTAHTPALASVLHAAGYDTAAITCCERFAHADDELAGFRVLDASADSVRMQRSGQSNADAVIARAQTWLRERAARPYFLWVHLYEPHSPYDAPAGPDLGSSDSARYDREVAYLDAQLATLLAEAPDALVVLTADHGEELGEHGIRFHARSLYNQVVRVPLLVRGPGVTPGLAIDTPVSIVDIAPTLYALAGATPPADLNGRSLVPALRGAALPARPVLIELPHDHQIARDMAAVVQPPHKVIWDREANAWSLYRLDDVADEHDLARDDATALAGLQRVLRETLDRETSERR